MQEESLQREVAPPVQAVPGGSAAPPTRLEPTESERAERLTLSKR